MDDKLLNIYNYFKEDIGDTSFEDWKANVSASTDIQQNIYQHLKDDLGDTTFEDWTANVFSTGEKVEGEISEEDLFGDDPKGENPGAITESSFASGDILSGLDSDGIEDRKKMASKGVIPLKDEVEEEVVEPKKVKTEEDKKEANTAVMDAVAVASNPEAANQLKALELERETILEEGPFDVDTSELDTKIAGLKDVLTYKAPRSVAQKRMEKAAYNERLLNSVGYLEAKASQGSSFDLAAAYNTKSIDEGYKPMEGGPSGYWVMENGEKVYKKTSEMDPIVVQAIEQYEYAVSDVAAIGHEEVELTEEDLQNPSVLIDEYLENNVDDIYDFKKWDKKNTRKEDASFRFFKNLLGDDEGKQYDKEKSGYQRLQAYKAAKLNVITENLMKLDAAIKFTSDPVKIKQLESEERRYALQYQKAIASMSKTADYFPTYKQYNVGLDLKKRKDAYVAANQGGMHEMMWGLENLAKTAGTGITSFAANFVGGIPDLIDQRLMYHLGADNKGALAGFSDMFTDIGEKVETAYGPVSRAGFVDAKTVTYKGQEYYVDAKGQVMDPKSLVSLQGILPQKDFDTIKRLGAIPGGSDYETQFTGGAATQGLVQTTVHLLALIRGSRAVNKRMGFEKFLSKKTAGSLSMGVTSTLTGITKNVDGMRDQLMASGMGEKEAMDYATNAGQAIATLDGIFSGIAGSNEKLMGGLSTVKDQIKNIALNKGKKWTKQELINKGKALFWENSKELFIEELPVLFAEKGINYLVNRHLGKEVLDQEITKANIIETTVMTIGATSALGAKNLLTGNQRADLIRVVAKNIENVDQTLDKLVADGSLTQAEADLAYEEITSMQTAEGITKGTIQMTDNLQPAADLMTQRQKLVREGKGLEGPAKKRIATKIEKLDAQLDAIYDKDRTDAKNEAGKEAQAVVAEVDAQVLNEGGEVKTEADPVVETKTETEVKTEAEPVVEAEVDKVKKEGDVQEQGETKEGVKEEVKEQEVKTEPKAETEIEGKGTLKDKEYTTIQGETFDVEIVDIVDDKKSNPDKISERKREDRVTLTVRDRKTGRSAGQISAWKKPNGEWFVNMVNVEDSHKRKGIASAMYKYIEDSGIKLTESKELTDDGKALRNKLYPKQETKSETPSSPVLKQVEKAKKAIAKVLPNVEFVLHKTTADMEKAIGENGRGAFQRFDGKTNNKIHINLELANTRTVAHEVFHAVLAEKFGSDVDIQNLSNIFVKRLSREVPKEVRKYLKTFTEGYTGDVAKDKSEEFMSELFGILANENDTFTDSARQIVKRFINKLAEKLGLGGLINFKSVGEVEQLKDLLNILAGKVAGGEVVTDSDLEALADYDGEPGSVITPSIKSQITAKTIKESVISKVNSKFKYNFKGYGRKIKLPKQQSIQEVLEKSGGYAVFINSDGTKVGVRNNGKDMDGGWQYTYIQDNVKDNIGFAATSTTHIKTLHTLTTNLANERDAKTPEHKGKPVAVFVTVQGPETMLGEWYAGEFLMEGIDKVLKADSFKGGLEGLRKSLTNAVKAKKYKGSKAKEAKALVDLINSPKFDTEKGRAEISKKLTSKEFTFGFRVDLLKSIIPKSQAGSINPEIKQALLDVKMDMPNFYREHMDESLLEVFEKEKFNATTNSVKGAVMGGYYTNPYLDQKTVVDNRVNGIDHDQFNESFTSNGETFMLDNAHDVNKLNPYMGYLTDVAFELYNMEKGTNYNKENSTREQRYEANKYLQDKYGEIIPRDKRAGLLNFLKKKYKGVDKKGVKFDGMKTADIKGMMAKLAKPKAKDHQAEKMVIKPLTSIGGSTYVDTDTESTVTEKSTLKSQKVRNDYFKDLQETKTSDPKQYWSVDMVPESTKGEVIEVAGGKAFVGTDGDIKGLFKLPNAKEKGVAQKLLAKAVEMGGTKLDNFDNYLTKQYTKAGFRVVSRTPFNEQYAPDGWDKELHGTPPVVAMVYDPNNEMDIKVKEFPSLETGYDQMIEHRDATLEKSTIKAQQATDADNANEMDEMYRTQEEELGKKNKSIVDRFKAKMSKSFDKTIDRQGSVKRSLRNIGLKDVVSYMVTKAGATSFAKMKVKDAYGKTFKNLTENEIVFLNKFIQLKRTISIENNRKKRGLKMVDRQGGFDAEKSESALREYKKRLGDKQFDKLSKRADNYFTVYKDLLKDMQKEGIITPELYDQFAEVDYKPTQYVQFLLDMDGDFMTNEADKAQLFGLGADQIRSMKNGSVGLEVMDAWGLLQGSIISRTKATFSNRLNNTFVKEFTNTLQKVADIKAKDKSKLTDKDKEFLKNAEKVSSQVRLDEVVYKTDSKGKVSTSFKLGSNTPGSQSLFYYKDGVKNRVLMKEEFFNKFSDVNQGMFTSGQKNFLSTVSGTKLVKSLATGNNPLFFVTNLPRDFMFTLIFSKEYDNNIPKNTIALLGDMSRGIKDVVKETDNYKKFLEYGGGMELLALQGRHEEGTIFQRMITSVMSQKAKDKIDNAKFFEGFRKFNLASEAGLRLVVFNKSIENQLREQGARSIADIPSKEQVDLLYTNAVRASREMTDFNQGGTLTKDADAFLPYLNASVQGTRAAANFAVKNPISFAWRSVQMAGLSTGLALGTSMAVMMLKGGEDDEDKDLTLADKYFLTLQTVSEYDLRNYFIIPTGEKDSDGNWKYWRVAKAHAMTPIINSAEHAMRKVYAANTSNQYYEKFGKTVMGSITNNILPIVPNTGIYQKIPAVGLAAAMLGKDGYTGNDLDYKNGKIFEENEGIVDDRVDPLYKGIGMKFGIAPVRLQKATESMITSPSVNGYVGLAYVAGNFTAKALSSYDLGEFNITETFTEPLLRRMVKSGSQYNLDTKMLDQNNEGLVDVERGRIFMEKEAKNIGKRLVDKNYDFDKATKEYQDLLLDNPLDAPMLKAMVENQAKANPRSSLAIKLMFTSDPALKGRMLYSVFGADLLNIEKQDENMQRVFNDLRYVKGQKPVLRKEDVLHYYDYVDKVTGRYKKKKK